ncbi:unnamed protein product [Rhodiola kirilowii]
MDHQWRPRPIQGNICPTCSNSHFPFCVPHPSSFDQNPRFIAPQNQPFHSPGMDMYRSPVRPQHHGFDGGFVNYDYYGGSDDRSRKRVRIDEMGASGAYANGNYDSNGYFGRPVSEEERRLKLIYDHGGAAAGHQPIQTGGVERSGHGAYPAQNGGDWGHHHYPNPGPLVHKPPNMAYPIPVESKDLRWNGPGPAPPPPHHSHNVRSSSVGPVGQSNFPVTHKFASPHSDMHHGSYLRGHCGMNMVPQNMNQMHLPPPLPLSPPPPLPLEPPRPFPYEHRTSHQSSACAVPSSFFPAHLGGSPGAVSPSFPPVPKEHHSVPPYVPIRTNFPNSAGQGSQEYHASRQTMPSQYGREEQSDMSKQWTSDKPKVIDAVHLFKQPYRATRPDHIVVILRGLPGSGKSYLAKMLRDIEVENGGEAPRIHSMDEYFMTEVEKPEEYENSKPASSARGKKTIMKKVMEYCYEPEMEEAYRSSMLKAFKKSLEAGGFTFIIVDDRNLRVADFAQFWAIAKRSGYEVYVLEAPYKDPAGCAARNVHNFTQDDIEKMAGDWEDAPSLYLQLDVKSLFHEDNLKETDIEEVDMDMEDEVDSDFPDTHGGTTEETGPSKTHSTNDEKQGDDDEVRADHLLERAKELGRSKWSDDLDDEDAKQKDSGKRKNNELYGMGKLYGKRIKSVRWGDQAKDTGFSIGAAKKASQSLVIGPGHGYNLTTNAVQAEYSMSSVHKNGNKHTAFQERLRAEHESFKDVFAKRKQKLGFVLQDE